MKLLITFTLLISLSASSQKIAFIDRQLDKPVVYKDNLTLTELEKGVFIIYEKDIDSVIITIESFRKVFASKKEIEPGMLSFHTGGTYYTAQTIPVDKGFKYKLTIDTKINKMGSFLVLSSEERSNKENLKQMDKFLKYLRKARG